MNVLFKRWMYQMVALLVAWAILLAATRLIEELCSIQIHSILITWLGVGIVIMSTKKVNFPFPLVDRVDVPGAFVMLWWAAFWPKYLLKI
jgi:hypothetical protein